MAKPDDKLTKSIDDAISKMMKNIDGDDAPDDVKIKKIQTAINWVKVKHAVKEDEEFDPASLG